MSSLWMGNLEPYMDEKFISRAFCTMGEQVVGVRIIRNKTTGGAAGYCFVELSDEATAERCLRKVNGKLLPGASPPKRFKLNRASHGRPGENSQLFSLFVGDLTPEVDDGMLYEFFYCRYPSCRGGNVLLDGMGNSRGCGFVHFLNQQTRKRALEECQGAKGLGAKSLRLSVATNKTNRYDTSDNRQPQSYNNQPYSNYYPSWGNHQNGGSYDQLYNYDQYNYTQDTSGAYEEEEDDGLEDPNPELDVTEANRQFMEKSEELYDALMECRWQPFHDSPGDPYRTAWGLSECV